MPDARLATSSASLLGAVVKAVRSFVERSLAPFARRLAALEEHAASAPVGVEIDHSPTNPRQFGFAVKLADGRVQKQCFSIPAMLYKDVWREGVEYEQGDAVTRSGSIWVCEAEKTTAMPGASGDWKLAVKAGRDSR